MKAHMGASGSVAHFLCQLQLKLSVFCKRFHGGLLKRTEVYWNSTQRFEETRVLS